MGECVMLETIASIIILTFCGLVLWGMILQTNDEHIEWKAKKEYDKMKKFIEENDSSKL
jgi:thiamine kinase-like enzyme